MQTSGGNNSPSRALPFGQDLVNTINFPMDGRSTLDQSYITPATNLSLPPALGPMDPPPHSSGSTPAQPPLSMAPQQQPPKRQICFDFTKNQCSRGANCKFSHDLNLIIQVNSQEKGICFDFLKGTCTRGPLCRFSHDLSNLQGVNAASAPLGPLVKQQNDLISAVNRTTAPICYDFVKNQCSRGPECKYSHDFSSILVGGPRPSAGKNPYVMCMDFVRGRCTRGASCKYAHFDPMQIAAAAASAGGVGIGIGGGGGGYCNSANMIAAAQAAMLSNGMNTNLNTDNNINNSLAGLTPQQAQALLAAYGLDQNINSNFAALGGGSLADNGMNASWPPHHQHQQQQQSGFDNSTSPSLDDDYSLSLMQLQQLALQNNNNLNINLNTPLGPTAMGINNTSNMNSLASTAEDVAPLPPLPNVSQQHQQQQSPNDASALSMLLIQQQKYRNQQQQQHRQQEQFIRAHHHQQQQQQRRLSNLGPSALPPSTHLNHLSSSTVDANVQHPPLVPSTTNTTTSTSTHLNQQEQQEQGWSVPFHHPLLQKVQSADLRGTSLRSGSGTNLYSSANTSAMHSHTNSIDGSGGIGGGGVFGSGGGASGTDSPTIRAAWGTIGTAGININPSSVGRSSSSAPTSQPSSLGGGSPLTDGVATAQYIQRQLNQQQQQQQQQDYQASQNSGLDALKNIWSKP